MTDTPSGTLAYECAVVTGASSGLGEEYARQLAPACGSMVLTARRGDLLEKLAEDLRQRWAGLKVHCITADLRKSEQREALFRHLEERNLTPDLLVNNAGMGDYGSFISAEWEKLDSMIQVNMTALTHFCHGILPQMIAREKGAIINVSSLASVVPIPDFAVYAATKSYVTSFSESLRMELREYSIPVLAVCPGPVHTEFGEIAMRKELETNLPSREGFYTEASTVVSDSLRALRQDKARVYPGWKVALLAGVLSVLPMVIVRGVQLRRRG